MNEEYFVKMQREDFACLIVGQACVVLIALVVHELAPEERARVQHLVDLPANIYSLIKTGTRRLLWKYY